ncbi:MAG: septation protein SpoVG family protein [Agathobacter sp.]|nr:septation protein SpoVG family protein [Agathobacter sp.]MBP3568125.1 septation protein SpoVG family protein [Lachnospiraceae bacterium]
MKIDVQIKLSDDYVNLKDLKEIKALASGWVTIENAIKFPVKVRHYTDKEDGKEKMFVSYPQKKTESGYDSILYPQDKGLRMDIEECVINAVHEQVKVFIGVSPPIDEVRVNLFSDPVRTGKISLNGMASVKMLGLVINGIMIKESEKGLFVQMPQHKADGQYRDTVYGAKKAVQKEIAREVLAAYEKELEKKKQLREPEPAQEKKQEQQQNLYSPKISGPKI